MPAMPALPRNLRRRPSGFTLIELLVAITLLALLTLIAWRGLDNVVQMRERLAQQAERTAQWQRVLGQLERDLQERAPDMALEATQPRRQVVIGGLPNRPGSVPTPGRTLDIEQALPLSLAFQNDAQRGPGTRLTVVRRAPAHDGQWQQVSWWVANGQLWRASGQPASLLPLPEASAADTIALLDGVQALQAEGWSQERGWHALPDAQPGNQPLEGLILRLLMRDGTRYERVLALP